MPSELLGLTRGSYEAYCLDEAIWYFGATVEAELEKASGPRKKSKAARDAESARKRVLAKYFEGSRQQQFADPAMMMG